MQVRFFQVCVHSHVTAEDLFEYFLNPLKNAWSQPKSPHDSIAQQAGKAVAEPLGHAGNWDEDSTAISFFLTLKPPEAAELSQVLPAGREEPSPFSTEHIYKHPAARHFSFSSQWLNGHEMFSFIWRQSNQNQSEPRRWREGKQGKQGGVGLIVLLLLGAGKTSPLQTNIFSSW